MRVLTTQNAFEIIPIVNVQSSVPRRPSGRPR